MRKNQKAAFSIDFIGSQPLFYYIIFEDRGDLRSEGLYFCGLQT